MKDNYHWFPGWSLANTFGLLTITQYNIEIITYECISEQMIFTTVEL